MIFDDLFKDLLLDIAGKLNLNMGETRNGYILSSKKDKKSYMLVL